MKFLPTNYRLRLSLYVVGGLLGSVLLVLGGLSFILATETGSRQVLNLLLERLNSGAVPIVSVQGSQGTLRKGLTLQGLHIADGPLRIEIEQFEIEWNPYSLLSARLSISQLQANGVRIRIESADPGSTAGPVLQPVTPIALPFTLSLGSLVLTDLELNVGGATYLITSLATAVQFSASTLDLTELRLVSPELQVEGELQLVLEDFLPLSGAFDWRYQGARLQALADQWDEAAGSLAVQGDLRVLQIDSEIISPLAVVSAGRLETGLAAIEESPRFEFHHQAEFLQLPFALLADTEFHRSQLTTAGSLSNLRLLLQSDVSYAELPMLTTTAQGQLSGSELLLDSIDVTFEGGGLQAQGNLSLSATPSGRLAFTAAHNDPQAWLGLQLTSPLTNASATGQVDFQYSGTDLTGSLSLDAVAGQIGSNMLAGAGVLRLNDGQLRIENLDLDAAGNRLQVNGLLGEELDLTWQINATDVEKIVSTAQGSIIIDGRLRGPASAPDLQLQGSAVNLQFGAVQLAAAHLNGTGVAGNYTISLQAEKLTLAGNQSSERLETISLNVLGSRTQHQLQVAANSTLGALRMELSGGFADTGWQNWQGVLRSVVTGTALGDWSQSSPVSLSLQYPALQMEEMCWQRDTAQLCLTAAGDLGGAMIVEAGLRDMPLSWFNAAPPGADPARRSGLPSLPPGTSVQGSLQADLRLELQAGQDYAAEFVANSNAAVVEITQADGQERSSFADADVYAGEEMQPQQYSIDRFELSGSGQNGDWDISTGLDFTRRDINDTLLTLSGNATAELQISGNSAVAGLVRLDVGDLGWLEALVPELTAVRGQLRGTAAISGQIDALQIAQANLSISDSAASIAPLGISLSGLNAVLRGTGDDQLEIAGSVVSGAGQLDFSGKLVDPYTVQRELSLTLSGADFLLLDREELLLRVTPDVTVTANRSGINLAGSLLVPELDLQLTELPDTAIDVSRDAVIAVYPADRPDLARSIAAQENSFYDLPVATDITLNLGEKVNFSGFGFDARLTGQLDISQEGNGASLTYGELRVEEGSYTVYGTRLQLERGELLFFGSYDNPALNIRAVREVEDLSVGLQINGTLKRINSQLYSSPVLPENDIMSVLLTGKPFAEIGDQDSQMLLNAVTSLGLQRSGGLTGQLRDRLGLDALSVDSSGDINNSILTIGKYLSPSLFVRYGVGLFDRESTVAVDYRISDTLTLEAESGEFQSVDFFYRIER